MEENLGAFEEKRNEAAETAESAGKGGKHLAKVGKRGWAIAGIALGVLAAAYLGLCAYAALSGTIYPNTTVGGVNYGGMTEEQAAAELTRRVIDAQSARLDFAVMEGDSCEVIAGVALSDIPVDIDCRKAADTLARVHSAKGGGFFKSGAGFLFSLFTEHEESIVSEEPFCAAAEPVLSHETHGVVYETFPLAVRRLSGSEDRVKAVADCCRAHHIPIRIGVNGGSLEKELRAKYGGVTAEALVESAMGHVRLLNRFDFDDICISVKCSDVPLTMRAYTLLSQQTDYPLHLGVTEAGTPSMGMEIGRAHV